MRDEALNRHWRAIGELVVQALVSHVSAQNARIGGQTSDTNSQVIVDWDDLLLEGAELGGGAFKRD